MTATSHLGFILAAYGAGVAVVGALVAWVMLDYRVQRRTLADLERRGFARRSAARTEPMEQAREDA